MISTATKDGIMVLETKGDATDIQDSPAFRRLVDDVRSEKVSPLVDLRPYLKGGSEQKLTSCSILTKFLMLTTTAIVLSASSMLMNEAKLLPDERSRLYAKRFGSIDTGIFHTMSSMPEYGDFPDLPKQN